MLYEFDSDDLLSHLFRSLFECMVRFNKYFAQTLGYEPDELMVQLSKLETFFM